MVIAGDPAARRRVPDLLSSVSGLQWVVDGYSNSPLRGGTGWGGGGPT